MAVRCFSCGGTHPIHPGTFNRTMSVDDMARLNHKLGKHWFDPDTMRFFDSRIEPPGGFVAGDKVYFVSSEKRDEETPRLYTVRAMNLKTGDVSEPIGEFQSYRSADDAFSALGAVLVVSKDLESLFEAPRIRPSGPRYRVHEDNGGLSIQDSWLPSTTVWFQRGKKYGHPDKRLKERAEKAAESFNRSGD